MGFARGKALLKDLCASAVSIRAAAAAAAFPGLGLSSRQVRWFHHSLWLSKEGRKGIAKVWDQRAKIAEKLSDARQDIENYLRPDAIPRNYLRFREYTPEAMQMVTNLKIAKKNPESLDNFLKSKTQRLLKKDLICLFHLLRQHREEDLCRRVFNLIKKESWYRPNVLMYWEMSLVYANSQRLDRTWELMDEMEAEGIHPTRHIFCTALRDCIARGEWDFFRKFYNRMQKTPNLYLNHFFYGPLIKRLENAGMSELASVVIADFAAEIELKKKRGDLELVEDDDFWRTD